MLREDADHTLDELIRRSTQVEIPAEVEERLRRKLMEFRTKVAERPKNRLRALGESLMYRAPVRIMAMTAAVLLAVGVALLAIPRESRANQVFAAAAAQLRSSQSLKYTIVLNEEPYVAVDFSYLAPGYRRIECSWGIEVRTNGVTGRQIVLMHAARAYLLEGGKQVESQVNVDDFVEQFRSLPRKADQVLGERWTGGKKLIGYRLRNAPNGSIPGLKTLDIWIDPGRGEADHVDITVQEQGKPAHEMHIRNIRVGAEVDRSLFDLTPPAGYTAIAAPSGNPQGVSPSVARDPWALRAGIKQVGALVAVVAPMTGSYEQTEGALQSVQAYLKKQGVTPAGPPLGRYWSEQHWEAGYPVPLGTQAEPPFQVVTLPAGTAASVVVDGPWGKDPSGRWGAFLKWILERGYVPAGPTTEIWSGADAQPASQSTEMRMPVEPGK